MSLVGRAVKYQRRSGKRAFFLLTGCISDEPEYDAGVWLSISNYSRNTTLTNSCLYFQRYVSVNEFALREARLTDIINSVSM